MINGIGPASQQSSVISVPNSFEQETKAINTAKETVVQQQTVSTIQKEDTFEKEIDSGVNSGTYDTATAKATEEVDVEALSQERVENYQNMITRMAGGQVEASKDESYSSLLDSFSNSQQVGAEQENLEAATDTWSADVVAEDILSVAEELADGDANNIATLRDAVIKGFGAAEEVWGDDLPDVTDETYEKIMNGLDELESKLSEQNNEQLATGVEGSTSKTKVS